MKYDIRQNGGELTVTVEGRLDTASAPELQKAVQPYLSQTDSIVYDFSKLDYISSAGLRTVSYLHMNMKMGGQSRAIHCNDVVKDVFEITKFNEIIAVE